MRTLRSWSVAASQTRSTSRSLSAAATRSNWQVQFGTFGRLLGLCGGLRTGRLDAQRQPLLLLFEEVHRDLAVVEQVQELPTPLRQVLHDVSRSLPGPPGRPGGRFPAAPGKLPANRLLEVSIGTHEPEAQDRRSSKA